MEDAETAEMMEDAAEGPAPALTAEGPAPAPAATLETVHERPHSEQQESQHTTLGYQPVQIVTFTYGLYLTWISGYPVQCMDSLQKLVNNTVFSLLA